MPRPRSELKPDAGRLLSTAASTGDWDAAAAVIDQQWTALALVPEHRPTMVEAVSRIPDDVLRRHRRVAFMAEGLGRAALVPDVAVPTTPAEIEAAVRSGEAREIVADSLQMLFARLSRSRVAEAWAHVNAMLPLVKAATSSPLSPATSIAAHWYLHAGQVGLLVGHYFRGHMLLSIGWTYRHADVIGNAEIMLAPYLALASSLLGDCEHAAEWSAVVDEYEPRSDAIADWPTILHTRASAMLLDATDRVDVEAGAVWFEQVADGSRFDMFWPATVVGVVRHKLSLGQADRAARHLAAATELHSEALASGGVHRSVLAMARVDLALVIGRANDVAAGLSEMTEGPFRIMASLYGARLALGAGDYPRARQLALSAETHALTERARREGSVLRAAAELALGNHDEAARLVRLPGIFTAPQRRTLSLIPAELNRRMRDELGLGDEMPPTHPLLAEADAPRAIRLTAAERRTLEALATPVSLDKVAENLFITRNTLKSHLRSVYAKLNASSREEAVATATDLGLL